MGLTLPAVPGTPAIYRRTHASGHSLTPEACTYCLVRANHYFANTQPHAAHRTMFKQYTVTVTSPFRYSQGFPRFTHTQAIALGALNFSDKTAFSTSSSLASHLIRCLQHHSF